MGVVVDSPTSQAQKDGFRAAERRARFLKGMTIGYNNVQLPEAQMFEEIDQSSDLFQAFKTPSLRHRKSNSWAD